MSSRPRGRKATSRKLRKGDPTRKRTIRAKDNSGGGRFRQGRKK